MDKQTARELDLVRSHHDVLNYDSLSRVLREKRFSLANVGVTYRWISHWYKMGILIGSYEDGKWKKFDLVEYVWLKMIIQMRKFNLSLEMIKRVKDNLVQEIPVSEVLGVDEVMDALMKLANENKRDEIRKALQDKDVVARLQSQTLNLFETLIMDVVSFHDSFSIFISSSQVVPVKHSSLENIASFSSFNTIFTGSFISISISEIVRDYMLGDLGIRHKQKLVLLTDGEEQVLKALREDNLKSVTVRYGSNQEIDLLETTKIEKVDKRARLMDFIMANGYQDITIKTQNGEIVYCENKRKKVVS
jgi:DNA-binding transcriptional MerR regulator